MSKTNEIVVPEFLKNDNSAKKEKPKKLSAKRQWLNNASFLNNDYSKRYPELGVEFYVPNTHLLYDESEYKDLKRKEMIELLLSIHGSYAVVTWRENKYKLLDAKRAYNICSEVLNINKGRKNSIRKSAKTDVKLLTPLDVFERYKKHGRFRKLNK